MFLQFDLKLFLDVIYFYISVLAFYFFFLACTSRNVVEVGTNYSSHYGYLRMSEKLGVLPTLIYLYFVVNMSFHLSNCKKFLISYGIFISMVYF